MRVTGIRNHTSKGTRVSAHRLHAAPPSFGPSLRSFREDRDLSQKALAMRIGRSNTTVSGWERGHHEPQTSEVYAVDRALGLPRGTLSCYLSGSSASRDIETFTLRRLLPPAATDSVAVKVHEDVTIDDHGSVRQVAVRQRIHAVRGPVTSYCFVWAQEPGPPGLRVTAVRGCTLRRVPWLLTAGRMVQEIHLDGPALRVGDEREFTFLVTYRDRGNPAQEAGLHRRVGTPTLGLLTMRAILPSTGGVIRQSTWPDRNGLPRLERTFLLQQQGAKVLRWDRPGEQTCGFTWRLA